MTTLKIGSREGHYDLMHPRDEQATFHIRLTVDAEETKVANVMLRLDDGCHLLGHDGDEPVELLAAIVAAGAGKFLYSNAYSKAKAMLNRIYADGQLSRDIEGSWLAERETALTTRRHSIEAELAKIAKALAALAEENLVEATPQ